MIIKNIIENQFSLYIYRYAQNPKRNFKKNAKLLHPLLISALFVLPISHLL